MRIAVTGASGFVGGYIAAALRERGHDVLPYGRRSVDALDRVLPGYRQWDIAAGALNDPEVDAVVHCAAHVIDWGSDAVLHQVNVTGTAHVLATFPSARRFVHMSSSSVYSAGAPLVNVREDAPIGACPYSAYGRTKAAAEHVVLQRRPDAVILRPHIVYGPGDTTLLPRVLAARRFGRLIFPGDGRNELSTTHIENLALAARLALENAHVRGVFNVADAERPMAGQLVRTVLARVNAPTRLIHLPRSLAWRLAATLEALWPRTARVAPILTRFAVKHLADPHTLDITRARTELGYAPTWTYLTGPLS